MFWLKGEIEKNNNFYKKTKKKIEIKTMRTKLIGKHNTINLDWMMKLKTNETFT